MFNFEKLIQAAQNYKILISSIKDMFLSAMEDQRTKKWQASVYKHLKSTLKCDSKYIEASYMFMGKMHLEVFPMGGIFLQSSHRLADVYPYILALDTDEISLKTLENALNGSLCPISTIKHDFTKQSLEFLTKFDTIAINFALDRIPDDKLEDFIILLKNNLKNRGMIFGVTVIGAGIKHTSQANEYIKAQNQTKVWHNENRRQEVIEELFAKHFVEVATDIIGSCLVFRVAPKIEKVDVMPFKPTLESVEGKFLYLN
jgi:hypothetical protein